MKNEGILFSLESALHFATIRVHGNGFLQIDENEKIRYHFWGHPDIPKQSTQGLIHDHIFSFESEVLKGQITNITLTDLHHGNEYEVHKASRGRLISTGQQTSLRVTKTETCWEGMRYTLQAGEIHDTYVACPTVTKLRKLDHSFTGISEGARVFLPRGMKPDNSFDRFGFDQDKLRKIAVEILKEGR